MVTAMNDRSAGEDVFLALVSALAGTGHVSVHNARGGFACNSSSSHSIVVLPEGSMMSSDSADSFDWEDFALTDSAEKIRYISAMMNHRPAAYEALAGLRERYGVAEDRERGVDHQSHISFPLDFYGSEVDIEFLTEFAEFLTNSRTVILGGHDNDGRTKHYVEGMVTVKFGGGGAWRARRDEVDGRSWWVLFNTYDGTKFRISFNPDDLMQGAREDEYEKKWRGEGDPVLLYSTAFTPAKAAAPELVDVKVTNKCAYEKDCGFCYMSSVKDGDEGDLVTLLNTVSALAEQQVFEIAFGGGEPTLWPHFTALLEHTRSTGVVPNFTTKNYNWTAKPEAEHWWSLVGSVAFSVNSRTAMQRLMRNIDKGPVPGHGKVSVQMIPDLIPVKDLDYILAQAAARRWRVTLLGYKQVGRGEEMTPSFVRPASAWLDAVERARDSHRMNGVAIDTALAVQSREELSKRGVPDWMYHLEEGTFSMYIDAVTGQVGPSSYAGPGSLTSVDLRASVADLNAVLAEQFSTYVGNYSTAGVVAGGAK